MIKFKGHQLQPLCAEEQMVVPNFKGLIKNYRASFPMMEPQLTKVKILLVLHEKNDRTEITFIFSK